MMTVCCIGLAAKLANAAGAVDCLLSCDFKAWAVEWGLHGVRSLFDT